MKTILYMAQSLNGYIAKDNGDSSWVGSADLKRFKVMTQQAGNVVMGRNTYEYLQTGGDFPLPGRLNVVMTRELKESDTDQILFTNKSPAEVLEYLRGQKFTEAMVIGGGKLAKSFLEENLIDELLVTIEPVILGRGIQFVERGEFVEAGDLEVQLRLIDIQKISENEIQLHYAVIRDQVLESDSGNESAEV